MSQVQVPVRELSNGYKIPIVGLGTYKADKPEELTLAIKEAIKAGYRHFDCAYIYFNEGIIGKAIRESIQESNGKLKREDFFIVSKCWNKHRKS
jgi:aldehyde reductase